MLLTRRGPFVKPIVTRHASWPRGGKFARTTCAYSKNCGVNLFWRAREAAARASQREASSGGGVLRCKRSKPADRPRALRSVVERSAGRSASSSAAPSSPSGPPPLPPPPPNPSRSGAAKAKRSTTKHSRRVASCAAPTAIARRVAFDTAAGVVPHVMRLGLVTTVRDGYLAVSAPAERSIEWGVESNGAARDDDRAPAVSPPGGAGARRWSRRAAPAATGQSWQ